jgi:hypothetical protein
MNQRLAEAVRFELQSHDLKQEYTMSRTRGQENPAQQMA